MCRTVSLMHCLLSFRRFVNPICPRYQTDHLATILNVELFLRKYPKMTAGSTLRVQTQLLNLVVERLNGSRAFCRLSRLPDYA